MASQNFNFEAEQGESNQPETSETDQYVPLELLLVSPFCWKPPKICSFILKSPDAIIYGSEDESIICQIKARAVGWDIWPKDSNWKDVLEDDFSILQTYRGKPRKGNTDCTIDTSSVLELLKLIRNKYKHCNEFSPEQKESLGWFRESSVDLERDDYLFVKYWTGKFPNLLPFLWIQFAEFRSSLREFYPVCLDEYYSNGLCIRMDNFYSHICISASHHLDQGMVEERFFIEEPGQIPLCVELRILPSEIIRNVLEGSSLLKLELSTGRFFVQSDTDMDNVLEYKVFPSPLTKASNTFVVTSASEGLESLFLSKMSECREIGADGFVTVFTTSSLIENISREFRHSRRYREVGISWWDLSESKRDILETSNEIRLGYQDHGTLLSDLFPGKESRRKLLVELRGKKLNELLRESKIEIFRKRQSPNEIVSNSHVERRLYRRDKLHGSIFQESGENDVFLVMNCSHDDLAHLVPSCIKIVDAIDVGRTHFQLIINSRPKIIIVGNMSIQSIALKLSYIDRMTSNYIRCHVLKYIARYTFKWLSTYGHVSPAEFYFSKAARQVALFTEHELIAKLKMNRDNPLIFIADKPGSGKSNALLSLASRMARVEKGTFVMFITMKEYLDKIIEGIEISRKLIYYPPRAVDMLSILTELYCADKLEQCVIASCLDNENVNRLKFELFLDGLDEIDCDRKSLALKCLQTITNEFHSTRVWVTLREYMLVDIWDKFSSVIYGLDPFSTEEQVEFLVNSWSPALSRVCEMNLENCAIRDMSTFAEKCIQIATSQENFGVSGSPLMLQIISEVYKKVVLSTKGIPSSVNPHHSLLELYDAIMERKLVIFLTDKNGFCQNANLDIRKDKSGVMRILWKQFINIHTFFAIKLLFGKKVAQGFQALLLGEEEDEYNFMQRIKLELRNQGLIEDFSPLRFSHRTFAENLVAKFVSQKVAIHLAKYNNLDSLDQNFKNLLWNNILRCRREQVGSCRYISKFEHPTLCLFLNGMLRQNHIRIPISDAKQSLLTFVRKRWATTSDSHIVEEFSPFFVAANIVKYDQLFILQSTYTRHMASLFIVLLRCREYNYAKRVLEVDEKWSQQMLGKLKCHENKGFGILHWILYGFITYDGEHKSSEISVVTFIRFILQRDSSVLEALDTDGKTPLLLFSKLMQLDTSDSSNAFKVLRFLVHCYRASVDGIDHSGNTILHVGDTMYTRYTNEEKIVLQVRNFAKLISFFMQNGLGESVINHMNREGRTPLMSALHYYGYRSIVTLPLFNCYGADFNARDHQGNTVLHNAIQCLMTPEVCTEGNKVFKFAFIRELLDCGADVLISNTNGQCALHLAVEANDIYLVKILIDHCPACLYAVDYDGRTVMDYKTCPVVCKYIKCKCNFE